MSGPNTGAGAFLVAAPERLWRQKYRLIGGGCRKRYPSGTHRNPYRGAYPAIGCRRCRSALSPLYTDVYPTRKNRRCGTRGTHNLKPVSISRLILGGSEAERSAGRGARVPGVRGEEIRTAGGSALPTDPAPDRRGGGYPALLVTGSGDPELELNGVQGCGSSPAGGRSSRNPLPPMAERRGDGGRVSIGRFFRDALDQPSAAPFPSFTKYRYTARVLAGRVVSESRMSAATDATGVHSRSRSGLLPMAEVAESWRRRILVGVRSDLFPVSWRGLRRSFLRWGLA